MSFFPVLLSQEKLAAGRTCSNFFHVTGAWVRETQQILEGVKEGGSSGLLTRDMRLPCSQGKPRSSNLLL